MPNAGLPNPRKIAVEATRDSRRSSLLSSVELEPPTENKVVVGFVIAINILQLPSSNIFFFFKTLSPGYYCQTAPARTDSPVPSDSGIYSPPTSILPFLEVIIQTF